MVKPIIFIGLLCGLFVLPACTLARTSDRAAYEKDVREIVGGYMSIPGAYSAYVNVGDRYCQLMTTGQYHLDRGDGSYSTPALVKAREEVGSQGFSFQSADRTMMVDATVASAQKFICPDAK
jgi:hypothetical protein